MSMPAATGTESRVRIVIRGAVQGVGFRPFVFRLARELGLTGWVQNALQGVVIEAEGDPGRLRELLLRIEREKPPNACIQGLEPSFLEAKGHESFEIRESGLGERSALVLPDITSCPACIREVFDPDDRRHLYPFTNCTRCGPRYSIIEALPYDRSRTTMRGFSMCAACRREYEDPDDRRFHAQPNACPDCGPSVALWGPRGEVLAERGEAMRRAARAVLDGRIVAVKGLGGFHLVVDAANEKAVRRLRTRKQREAKPLALMYPSLERVREDCEVSSMEERLLLSREAPIVLLGRRQASNVAPAVAPGNPWLGVMLPYTPLHHVLLGQIGRPVVATSGNLTDEPICTDEHEALERLSGVADLFLVHDRPILRHVDDSIVRVVLGRELCLRRARGYVPLPVETEHELPDVLAVGGHLKNVVATSAGRNVFLSPHIGDLETREARDALGRVVRSLESFHGGGRELVACDLHPDYASTAFARSLGRPLVRVQHHHAHVLSCIAENRVLGPVLGVAWDGTGHGTDGTVWGGEFLRVGARGFERVAHLRTFRLPGGERAAREPRRAALGLLHERYGDAAFDMTHLPPLASFEPRELGLLRSMLGKKLRSVVTSSAGRLFDAVASLLGIRQTTSFEGQAAMELEHALHGIQTEASYDFGLRGTVLDWGPMLDGILEDRRSGMDAGEISARFHRTLVEMLLAVVQREGTTSVALTGGCFQNVVLLTQAVQRLREAGFRPCWHQRVPPGDGGLALGQVMAACREAL